MLSLLPSGHAAFETCGQIGITGIVEEIDDLLLDGVCQFHFALRGHSLFMWGGLLSAHFLGYVVGRVDDGRRVGLELPGCVCGNF